MVKQYSQAYYVAKYMKLYSAVFCCIEYGRAAPSRGLPFYEQFPRVLKPIREGCTNENPEKVWSFTKPLSDPAISAT